MTDAGLDPDASRGLAVAALALARRFAAGATMWCASSRWPEHARHLAVELVHPVVVGKRALPALSVTGDDPVGWLRAAVRPGDLLVTIDPAGSALAAELAARAPAWGLTTVRLGAGPCRPDDRADHVVWVDDATGTAAHDGRLVLRYHLLWELTHVCFEHPGLLAPDGDGDDPACTTCGDVAAPAEVARVLDDGLVEARTACGPAVVDTTLVGPVGPGDLVLVHAGTAIERLAVAHG